MSIQYFYYLTAYFLLYSFLGWVLEVCYHALKNGQIVNRGFLNGPMCPIYGVGMMSVLIILEPFTDNPVLLFIFGTAFATLIELAGGFVLFKLFHMRWWDYSNEPFNLGGFICARFSVAWGACIVFAVLVVHPFVELNVYLFDRLIGYIFVIICYLTFVADCIITVLTIARLNKNLHKLNALARKMRGFSDDLTEVIGSTTIETSVKVQEGRVQMALAKAEMRDQMEAQLSEAQTQMEQTQSYVQSRVEELQRQLPPDISELRDKAQAQMNELREQTAAQTAALTDKTRAQMETAKEQMGAAKQLTMEQVGAAKNLTKEQMLAAKELTRAQMEELRSLLTAHRHYSYGRMLRAFPGLKHSLYNEELAGTVSRMKEKRAAALKSKYDRKHSRKQS